MTNEVRNWVIVETCMFFVTFIHFSVRNGFPKDMDDTMMYLGASTLWFVTYPISLYLRGCQWLYDRKVAKEDRLRALSESVRDFDLPENEDLAAELNGAYKITCDVHVDKDCMKKFSQRERVLNKLKGK